MADIAEITLKDREKIKAYVESSNFLTYKMLAERFNIDKSYLSLILNGKRTSAEANKIIDSIITMYELWGEVIFWTNYSLSKKKQKNKSIRGS